MGKEFINCYFLGILICNTEMRCVNVALGSVSDKPHGRLSHVMDRYLTLTISMSKNIGGFL